MMQHIAEKDKSRSIAAECESVVVQCVMLGTRDAHRESHTGQRNALTPCIGAVRPKTSSSV